MHWPESPKRKGKRNTERLPYVLTSGRWQKIVDDKSEKRKAEEEAQGERKRLMEQKKKEKGKRRRKTEAGETCR